MNSFINPSRSSLIANDVKPEADDRTWMDPKNWMNPYKVWMDPQDFKLKGTDSLVEPRDFKLMRTNVDEVFVRS